MGTGKGGQNGVYIRITFLTWANCWPNVYAVIYWSRVGMPSLGQDCDAHRANIGSIMAMLCLA